MTFASNLKKGALAALMIVGSTAGAFAYTASATTTLNVRSGPGTHFRVVNVLRDGERVDVQYCRGSWCFLAIDGADGWASENYLRRGYYRPAPPRWERPAPPRWEGDRWDRDRDWDRRDRDRWDRDDRWDRNDHRWDDRGRRDSDVQGRVCFSDEDGYFCFGGGSR